MALHIDGRGWTCAVAAATTLGANTLTAQPAFEGVVTMKLAGMESGGPRTMKYYVKGGVLRMEMEGKDGGQGYTITDPRRQISYMVMPGQRMYMEMSVAPKTAKRIGKSEPKITKTGRTETIAGHTCEHWIIKVEAEESDVCVAKGLGRFFGMSGGRQGEPAWISKLGADFFPLRYSKVGQTRASLEVTRIEKRSLDAALFVPPAGFRKMTMPPGAVPQRP
ncbi:MAG: DUF4412 domain-containing protein [Gemmatimonadaceae bacterium]